MKIFYKLARKYMHLYAESQRENKALSDKYMASLQSQEELLNRLYDKELEIAKLKLGGVNDTY